MTFFRENFSPIGNSPSPIRVGSSEAVPGSPSFWSYRSNDPPASVDSAGYFNDVRALLAPGDMIYRVTIDGVGAVTSAGWHVVTNRTALGVDVSDTTAVVITNTD